MKTATSLRLYLTVTGTVLISSLPAYAKISFTAPGSIVVGYDATCTGNAGAVRFNSSGPSLQWCNGTSWTTISAGSVAASGTIGATSGLTIYLTNGSAAAPSLQFYNAAGTGLYYVATSTLNFATNGVQRGVFDASGNFNLVTTAGRYQTNGNDLLYRPNSGADTTSIALSGAALSSQNVSNAYNIGIGTWAGKDITTGTHNTAVGANSLQGPGSATTGSNNTAIGSASLNQATGVAAANTAVGFNAGNILTTGGYNTIAGSTSGDAITTGSSHTIIGGAAGRSYTTTFSSGTTLGYSCTIPSSTTVSSGNLCGGGASGANTFLGALSGYGVGNASAGNTGVGEYTFSPGSSYTINYNTAVGNGALRYARSSAANNAAAGSIALNTLTTGSSNTAIGYSAGNAGTAITTGGTNTFLGATSQTNSASTANGMAIGYGASTTSNVIQLGNASVNVLYSYGSYSSTSDRRHKTDIRPLPDNLGGVFINKLEPVSYRFNHGDETLRFGFIAQDLEQALPKKLQNVIENSEPGKGLALLQRDGDAKRTYRLTYSELLASIIKTIQEQNRVLQTLGRDVAEQRQSNNDTVKLLTEQTRVIALLKSQRNEPEAKTKAKAPGN